MVKVPAPLQAAGGVPGGRASDQKRRDEPERGVNLREAGEAKADPKRAESQDRAACERFLPQTEDGKAKPHSF